MTSLAFFLLCSLHLRSRLLLFIYKQAHEMVSHQQAQLGEHWTHNNQNHSTIVNHLLFSEWLSQLQVSCGFTLVLETNWKRQPEKQVS